MTTTDPRVSLLTHVMGTHRRELQSRGCTGCDWRAPRGTTDTRDPAQTRARHEAFNEHLAALMVHNLDGQAARLSTISCTCCCGEQVSAMAGTCDRCSMAGCSGGWCIEQDAPAAAGAS